MRKTFILIFAALFTCAAYAQKQPSEKKMGAYLFTYFNDPTHSLYMAVSYDGYHFKAVNDSKPIIAGTALPTSAAYATRISTADPTDGFTSR